MATFTQATRPLTIESVLGADKLILTEMYGEEGVAALPIFSLEMVSDDKQIPAERMLGSAVTIGVEATGGTRWFHGIVSRFGQGETTGGMTAYAAEVVSWPWLLSLWTDCRIFQNQSVPEIIEAVFKDRGQSDFELRLRGSYPKREYCVQYNESDLAFVMRLMEDEGIFWFVEHEKSRHVLVLCDHPSSLKPVPGAESLHMAVAGAGWDAQDVVMTLRSDHRVRPGKVTLTDYDPLKPSAQLLKSDGGEKGDIYEYPGGYRQHDDGERRARLRLEEQEMPRHVVRGEGTSRLLRPGGIVEIAGHERRSFNAKYHVTQVRHSMRQGGIVAGDDGGFEYRNEFLAIPKDVPFRPPRTTPRPRVAGAQTATVVGKSGEEIWTDKYGRVKVQFHWDRVGKKDDKSSCWVRVATPWAGKQWGAVHIPRMGQEVVVDFLEGDPDQPIIIGSVYNGEQMPPWTLPGAQTQSGLRSRSSKSGGADNVNELRFEDKKGSEEIFLHAEKDLKVEVEHDETRNVDHDRTTVIRNNDTRTVKDGNDVATIEKGNQTVTVKMGNQTISIDQGNQELVVKMGNQTTKVNLGKSATEAMQSIELKVGQSSIKLDQSGVTIKGLQVKVEGQVKTAVKAPITQVSADGMLQLKGGITMIN